MSLVTPRRTRIKPGDEVLVFAEVSQDKETKAWTINSLGLGVFDGYFESVEDKNPPMSEEEQVIYFSVTGKLPVERIIMYDQDIVFSGEEVYWDQVEVMQSQLDSLTSNVQYTHTEPLDYREYLDYRERNNKDYQAMLRGMVTIYNPKLPQGRA